MAFLSLGWYDTHGLNSSYECFIRRARRFSIKLSNRDTLWNAWKNRHAGSFRSDLTQKYKKKRDILRCIHHFKLYLINNMNHMRILGNEPTSVILCQTKKLKMWKWWPESAKTSWGQTEWCYKTLYIRYPSQECLILFLILDQQWLLTDQTFHRYHDFDTELDLHRITSGFYGAFATDVACKKGTLILSETWFRPLFGTCLCSSCWDQFSLAASLFDFTPWIPFGTFSVLLRNGYILYIFCKQNCQSGWINAE